MNIYRGLLWFPALTICVLISTGCTSVKPMVNTWGNPVFAPTPTNSIALKMTANARPEEAETGRLLAAELKREGFVVMPEEQADYLLSYVVSENVEQHILSNTLSGQSPMQETKQTVNGPATLYVYSGEEKSYQLQVRDIRLFLYANPATNPHGLQLAWQGTITIGKDNSVKGEQALLRTLLHYFGKIENGKVDLVK
jgi:hypothetical protein